MKLILISMFILFFSFNVLASGCDGRSIIVLKGGLKKIEIAEDLGGLTSEKVSSLIREFESQYGMRLWRNSSLLLPKNSLLSVYTQWITYTNLDNDCGHGVQNYTVKFKQLIIRNSDNSYMLFPDIYDLNGEYLENGSLLEVQILK